MSKKKLCSKCRREGLHLIQDPYSGEPCCLLCWLQRALDAERALREQKKIYVVLSLTNTQHGMAIGPVHPGAFWTAAEAGVQVENLVKNGVVAWVEPVTLGNLEDFVEKK